MDERRLCKIVAVSPINVWVCVYLMRNTFRIVDKHQYRCTWDTPTLLIVLFSVCCIRYTIYMLTILENRILASLCGTLSICDCYYYRSSSSCWPFWVWMLSPGIFVFYVCACLSRCNSVLYRFYCGKTMCVDVSFFILCRLQTFCACFKVKHSPKERRIDRDHIWMVFHRCELCKAQRDRTTKTMWTKNRKLLSISTKI